MAEWAQEDGIANEEFVQRIDAAADARAVIANQIAGNQKTQ